MSSDPLGLTPELRPRSRMRGPHAIVGSLKRLRSTADKAACYRRDLDDNDRRWCLRVADSCEALLTEREHPCR